MELKQKVLDYLTHHTSIQMIEVHDDTLLMEQAGVDSLQLIELILWVETETGRPVEMEQLLVNNDISVRSISNYLMANSLTDNIQK
jgi:acyl carrier protein